MGKNDLSLVGPIKGKTFLEIGCGSGHSVKYLIKHGAKKVYALDISDTQLELARKLNAKAVKEGRAIFVQSPMEKKIKIPAVDTVFSIYAMGWATDPLKVFKNAHSYLKPGGQFTWSWGHKMFSDIKGESGRMHAERSYFDESPRSFANFENAGPASYSRLKPSTWFTLMQKAGFEVTRFVEAEPANLRENIKSRSKRMGVYYSPTRGALLPSTVIFSGKKNL
ncbi:MAG: class I SAM-dependent methyltransferase [Patescibacteria group bacterium]